MSLKSEMDLYIEGLESPANAWGVHYVKSWDGDVASHQFLGYMMVKYGRDVVRSELNKRFNREVTC